MVSAAVNFPSSFLPCAALGAGILLGGDALLVAAPPVVSNVRAAQRAGTGLVDITYDVADADGDHVAITVAVSFNAGVSYTDLAQSLSGLGYGQDVTPGTNNVIVWDAGADLDPALFRNVRVKVAADDGYWAAPSEMAHLPAGSFQMGDPYVQGNPDERPTHVVSVGAVYVDKCEITYAFWQQVCWWGIAHGYEFDHAGAGLAPTHPVQSISWYDAVKWANARSEMRGLTPVYYTSTNQEISEVYRVGQVALSAGMVKWSANGFRLPTEAEWEKAARGGLAAHHYPWASLGGDYSAHINTSKANYGNAKSGTMSVGYYNGAQTPSGVDMANGHGLYDMAGNVWEWCWDWYGSGWYGQAGAAMDDTRGPGSGSSRVVRGGSWSNVAILCRVSSRLSVDPSLVYTGVGFRLARGQP